MPSKLFGTLLGILAFGLYSVSDTSLKWLGAGLHPLQILFFSCLFALPLILAYTAWAYWVFRGKVADEGYH